MLSLKSLVKFWLCLHRAAVLLASLVVVQASASMIVARHSGACSSIFNIGGIFKRDWYVCGWNLVALFLTPSSDRMSSMSQIKPMGHPQIASRDATGYPPNLQIEESHPSCRRLNQ
jgi:hypothetical protein